jgi:hypothetical protein
MATTDPANQPQEQAATGTSSGYTLVATELPAIRQLLLAQAAIGPTAPQSIATVLALMDQLGSLSSAYPNVQNGQFQGWLGQLYSLAAATPTVYDQSFAALYIVYQYHRYFVHGVWFDALSPWDDFKQHFFSPAPQPPSWHQTLAGLLASWGESPPGSILAPGLTWNGQQGDGSNWPQVRQAWNEAATLEATVLSAASWTDFARVLAAIQPVWQAQSATMSSLLQAPSLKADAYFFLLHLLIALGTSTPSDQQLAEQIVNAPTSSPENPNDVFVNQLLYAALMYLADPFGAFDWDNAQLQQLLTDLSNTIVSTDGASTMLKQSLGQHLKVLIADASYPMQDPYNPGIGFTTRQTDTLYALDTARASIARGQAGQA